VKRLKASRPARCCSTAVIPGRLGHGAVDQRAGHGRRLQAARRGRDDGALEMTLGMKRVREIVEKDFKGSIDFVAAERAHDRFRGPGLPPYTLKEMNGVRVAIIGQAFRTRDRQPRYWWPTGLRRARRQHAEVGRRGARQGRAGVVVLSHNGMDVDLKMPAGCAASTRSSRTHARRRAGADDRQQRRRADAGHQRRQQRQVPRRAGLRRQGQQGQRLSLQAAAGVRQPAAADGEMAATSSACARRTRRNSARSSPSPRGCCTGAATSTAPSTSSSAMR